MYECAWLHVQCIHYWDISVMALIEVNDDRIWQINYFSFLMIFSSSHGNTMLCTGGFRLGKDTVCCWRHHLHTMQPPTTNATLYVVFDFAVSLLYSRCVVICPHLTDDTKHLMAWYQMKLSKKKGMSWKLFSFVLIPHLERSLREGLFDRESSSPYCLLALASMGIGLWLSDLSILKYNIM